jgi:LEA14-like dessication related protein
MATSDTSHQQAREWDTNMKIYNPTENEVRIVIEGILYTVDANSFVQVKDSVGTHWLKVHEFLRSSEESVEMPKEVKAKKVEEKKEEDSE